MSQHITLPLGGQKGAISPSFGPEGHTLFVEVTLAKNNTKAWSAVIRNQKMDRDKRSSAKMEKIISRQSLPGRAVISRCGLNMQVCR